jgi:hypothetical protein
MFALENEEAKLEVWKSSTRKVERRLERRLLDNLIIFKS